MREFAQKRFVAFGFACWLFFTAGCFIPFVDIGGNTLFQRVDIGTSSEQITSVHAFRVTTTTTTNGYQSMFNRDRDLAQEEHRPQIAEVLQITEVMLGHEIDGNSAHRWVVPAQKTSPFTLTGYHLGPPFFYRFHHIDTFSSLYIYRPGYEIVDIADSNHDSINWQAAGIQGQTDALDRLFFPGKMVHCGSGQPLEFWVIIALKPGSSAPAHRKALLFGAAEYDRLAQVAQAQPGLNDARPYMPSWAKDKFSGGRVGPLHEYLEGQSKHLRDLANK